MSEITIVIPEQILIDKQAIADDAEIPLIPASKIVGQIDASQIPLGVIPGGADLEQLGDQVREVAAMLNQQQQAGFLTSSDLQDHAEASGRGAHVPLAGISNTDIAPDAAIEWSKIDTSGLTLLLTALLDPLQAQLNQKASNTTVTALDTELTALELSVQSLGAALALKANATHAHSVADISELQAALDSAQVQNPEIGSLAYTASQSSVYGQLQGSYANFTDGDASTGAATQNGSLEWIQADLGAVKYVDFYALGLGSLPSWGEVTSYLAPARTEVSTDGTNWLHLRANQGEVVLGGSPSFAVGRRLRYLRFVKSGYIALTGLFLNGY